jgi:hypothetical protein
MGYPSLDMSASVLMMRFTLPPQGIAIRQNKSSHIEGENTEHFVLWESHSVVV